MLFEHIGYFVGKIPVLRVQCEPHESGAMGVNDVVIAAPPWPRPQILLGFEIGTLLQQSAGSALRPWNSFATPDRLAKAITAIKESITPDPKSFVAAFIRETGNVQREIVKRYYRQQDDVQFSKRGGKTTKWVQAKPTK